MNLDTWIDGLDVLDGGEQVPRRFIDIEASETVIGG